MEKGKFQYVINDDKITHKGFPSSVIPIPSVSLTKMITESLKTYPRKYLFTTIRNLNKPMSYNYFSKKFMPNIWKLEKRSVGIDIYRSSYISYFYEKYRGIQEREALAKMMRHRRETAEKHYAKVTGEREENIDELSSDSEEEPQKKGKRIKERRAATEVDIEDGIEIKSSRYPIVDVKEREYFNLKDWSKKYRKDNPSKFRKASKTYYQKNREDILVNKILFNLNVSRNTAHPTAESIKKYQLHYNRADKVWESDL